MGFISVISYYPFTNLLLTSWHIQVCCLDTLTLLSHPGHPEAYFVVTRAEWLLPAASEKGFLQDEGPIKWNGFFATPKRGKRNDLGGGFNDFLFSPLFGEDSHFDPYFSDGLKPPTRDVFFLKLFLVMFVSQTLRVPNGLIFAHFLRSVRILMRPLGRTGMSNRLDRYLLGKGLMFSETKTTPCFLAKIGGLLQRQDLFLSGAEETFGDSPDFPPFFQDDAKPPGSGQCCVASLVTSFRMSLIFSNAKRKLQPRICC